MDIKVKEEVLEVHEDYSDVFFDCDIVKEEATIQEVNVPFKKREKEETATNDELLDCEADIDYKSKVEVEQGYKCEICGKIFSKAPYLKLHMLAHSEKRNFQCTICQKTFKHNQSLNKHTKIHTEDPIQCVICKTIIKNSSGLRDHMKRQHKNIKIQYECEKCDKILSSKTTLRRHIKLVHDNFDERKFLPCLFCDMVFKYKSYHKRHIYSMHPENTLTCKICNKRFTLRGLLLRHQKTHSTPDNGSNCIYCTKYFEKRTNLQTHMKIYHRGLPNVKGATPSCTICKKVYKNIANLKKHVAEIHRFECANCGLKSTCKLSLQRHIMRVHLKIPDIRNRKDAKCSICSISIAKRYLKEHMTTHSTEKPFTCDTCGKKYKTNAQLRRHNNSHVPLKKKQRMKCFYCKKIFYVKSSLSTHTRERHHGLPVNAKDPPFKCTVCQKSYKKIDDLKEHVTIHRNDVKCSICGKTFIGNRYLKQHIKNIHQRKELTKESSSSREIYPDSTNDSFSDIIEISETKIEVEDI